MPTPHKRIHEYDGAFHCLDCGSEWGALPGHPTEPKICKPKPRTSIKDWLWSQHLPGTLRDDFEKLFALPEKWRMTHEEGRPLGSKGSFTHEIDKKRADELSAILEGKD